MSDADSGPVKAPWHLWVVGGLSFLWNAVGVFDFVMTQTRNEAYMAQFSDEQLAYFYGFPRWVVSAWGVATIGSLLGSLLLLMRRGLAAPVLLVAFIAMVITTIYNFVLTDGAKMMGGIGPLIFSAVIFLIGLLLVIYARRQRMRGVLR